MRVPHIHTESTYQGAWSLMRTKECLDLWKNNGAGFMVRMALGQTTGAIFTRSELRTIAKKFKKYGFKMTTPVIVKLQMAAEEFYCEENEYEETLRLSEERKNYEAIHDSLTELTERFRNWYAPLNRSQFVSCVTDHYCQVNEELNEPFRSCFANLTKQFDDWDAMWSILQFSYQNHDSNQQDRKEFGEDIDPFSQFYLAVALSVHERLEQFEQLTQTFRGLFADVLSNLPQDEGGRRKDWPLHSFILRLKEIWEEGTAKKAGRSRNPHTQEIEGPFVRFVRICLSYLEPEKPYSSLGETIHKVLQAETVTRNGKNLPQK